MIIEQDQSMLNAAIEHHKSGRLVEAEQIYRQILQRNPNHPDALHLLGLVAAQAGHPKVASEMIERAIAIFPGNPNFYSNLAEVKRTLGEIDKAMECCRKAIELKPDLSSAYINLAVLHQNRNELNEAFRIINQALQFSPNDAAALRVLGSIQSHMGNVEAAIQSLQRSATLNSSDHLTHLNLGGCFEQLKRHEEAIRWYLRSSVLSPRSHEPYTALGLMMLKVERFREAVDYLRLASRAEPNSPEVAANLAAALERNNEFEEAMAVCLGMIEKWPNFMPAYIILSNALLGVGRFEEGIDWLKKAEKIAPAAPVYQSLAYMYSKCNRLDEALEAITRAIGMIPHDPEAHFNRALILLLQGRMREAWSEYEWRWKHPRMPRPKPQTSLPEWDGSPLNGKRIMLYGEQGFGDTIHFARLASMAADRGGRVILRVQPEVMHLVKSVRGVESVVSWDDPLPQFDTLLPLLSLPRIFDIGLDTIPAQVPYVSADPERVARMRQIIGGGDGLFRVGIGWEGGSFQRENYLRSAALKAFAPLAAIPGVRFYSLQKGPAAKQSKAPPPGLDFVDLNDHIKDFSDTAAAIANFDMVISIDTAVVHVAGALAKPVWTLMAYSPGHMWMYHRSDTPWYPTMRIWRQKAFADWSGIMLDVRDELRKVVENGRAGT